jgi:large subunit ribosomal protein L29
MKAKDIAKMGKAEIEAKLIETKQELAKERATVASGTRSDNPGKIRKLRRDIAKMITIITQKEVKE